MRILLPVELTPPSARLVPRLVVAVTTSGRSEHIVATEPGSEAARVAAPRIGVLDLGLDERAIQTQCLSWSIDFATER